MSQPLRMPTRIPAARPEMIRTGRYPEIMAWLRDHVHRYANRFGADEVLRLATGESFNDEYYFRWLEDRYHIV